MKNIFKSKTLWFNVISLGLGVAGGQIPGVDLKLDPATQLILNGVGNIILRKLTTEPVAVLPK